MGEPSLSPSGPSLKAEPSLVDRPNIDIRCCPAIVHLKSRRWRRLRALIPIHLVLALAVPVLAQFAFITVIDTGGANDAVAQSDLTVLSFDGSQSGDLLGALVVGQGVVHRREHG